MHFKFFVLLVSMSMIAVVTNAQADSPDSSVCHGQQKELKSICKRAVASGCAVLPTKKLRTCERFEERFRSVTGGDIPPWLASPNPDTTAQLTPINLSIPHKPQPVRGTDGKYHLAYELQILNFGAFPPTPAPPPPATITIERLAIFGDDPDGEPVMVLEGQALAERMQLLHLSAPFPGSLPAPEIQPGQSAIVFLDIVFDKRTAVPRSLINRVTIAPVIGTGPDPIVKVVERRMDVDPTPVIVIGPYLRGGDWANFNGCCDFGNSAHRRVVRSVNGTQYSPERYAVDVIQANPEFKVFTGTGDLVEDWFGTGEDVLSVADGVVTRVVTGLDNNPIGEFPFPPIIDTGGGNEVLVRIGEGLFAMYGHLNPGSVSLNVGDRVSRGEVIGKLGNTGITTAPHLHFQIMDANSIAETEGLPFVFDEFELIGTYDGINDDGSLDNLNVLVVPERRYEEMPLQNSIVRFP